MIISHAATIEKGGHEEKVVMINDVARAFFEAPMRRELCVELPNEARLEGIERREAVGLLELSLYGTRDAAANFQAEVKKFMESVGFKQCKFNPSLYYHQTRQIRTLVHGDDFVSASTTKMQVGLKNSWKADLKSKLELWETDPGRSEKNEC